MRKSVRLPLGVLALVLLVLLAMTGVGYGLWAKTLTIDGTVLTGEVTGEWTGASCLEFHDWPWPAEGSGEVEGKDVGATSWEVVNNAMTMLITISNGYPSYAVDCQIEFSNTGTIPAKIRGWQIQPLANLNGCVAVTGGNLELLCDELTVVLIDGVGSQLEPTGPTGIDSMAASSLRVHVEQPAAMLTEYTFAVSVCLGQWNEEATPGACFAAAP